MENRTVEFAIINTPDAQRALVDLALQLRRRGWTVQASGTGDRLWVMCEGLDFPGVAEAFTKSRLVGDHYVAA